MSTPFIYLDHAATSWPKDDRVGAAMVDFLKHKAGNPGRGGHILARAADDVIEEARFKIAQLINAPSPSRVILTHSCTDSLNLAIHGTIIAAQRAKSQTPMRVVASSLEHNAVLRTLHHYHADGVIELVQVGCDQYGQTDPEQFAQACHENTLLACLTHSSNAMGTIQPLKEAFAAVGKTAPNALTLVDSAQTLGHIGVDVQDMGIDLLAIAGHKGLGGPTGTGALYVSPRVFPDNCQSENNTPRIYCHRRGGTGSKAPGLQMPDELPVALEAGTTNAVGFAGLIAALKAADPKTHEHEMKLTARLLEGLNNIQGVKTYGVPNIEGRTPVVLFNIQGTPARQVANKLDRTYNIATRAGEHCAPLAHFALGNNQDGGVRVSPGPLTTFDEIEQTLAAVASIAEELRTAKPRANATSA